MKSVLEMFYHQVSINGTKVAVEHKDTNITYNELNRTTNQIANFLRKAGVGVGSYVGIMMEQDTTLLKAVLGVFKAQAAIVPVDIKFPDKRIEYMFNLVQPVWVITQSKDLARLQVVLQNSGCNPQILVIDQEDLSTVAEDELELTIVEKDPCYVYFTSGSTGTPKGIVGCHHGLSHFINWEIETFGLTEHDKVTQLSNAAHDPYLRDIFAALCAGGTVVIPGSRETILDRENFAEWLEESEATLVHCVPALFKGLVSIARGGDQFKKLRYILMAGEQISVNDTTRWYRIFGSRIQLVNMYGATETTMVKLYHMITESDYERGFVPVGKPMKGAKVVILDENLKVCPPGKKGEIYIRTPYMTLGYFNDLQRTREVFMPNPLTGKLDDLVYKTGDLGVFGPDGNVQFIGRIDNQIKLRGQRIEPGEIESVLLGHPDINEAIVIDREDQSGELYLAGYFVATKELPGKAIRQYLADHLPEYMIPNVFIQLEKLPLSPIGKVDRQALPDPNTEVVHQMSYVAPRNKVEEELAKIWADVLGVKKVGILDNFFDLGGHSLKAVRVATKAYKVLKLNIPLTLIFENPTISELVEVLAEPTQNGSIYDTLVPRPQQQHYAVSHSQKRLWIIDQMQEKSGTYNMAKAVILKGQLDLQAFTEALQNVMQKHETLRTRFGVVDNEIVQIIEEGCSFDFKYFESGPADLDAFIEEEVQNYFDLSKAGLIRACLVKLHPEEHLLVLTMHHIVSDAWSLNVLIQDIAVSYNLGPAGFTPLPIQYRDYALWQNEVLSLNILKEQQQYWLTRFSDELPLLNLPIDFPRQPIQSHRGAAQSFKITPELTAAIDLMCKKQNVSRFMVFLSAYYMLLHRYAGQSDLIVGTPVAGRFDGKLEGLVGYFLNVLALRMELIKDWSFQDLLINVKEVTLEAFKNQDYPIDLIIGELDLKRDMARPPLFETMFNLINTNSSEVTQLRGLEIKEWNFKRKTCKFDLALTMVDAGDYLVGEFEYSIDLFYPSTIAQMVNHYLNLLGGAVEHPRSSVNSLKMLSEEETVWLVEGMNQTHRDYPAGKFVHQIFEEYARQQPEEVAVIGGEEQLTYQELNSKANQLARELKAKGVGRDRLIGVMFDRSITMVIGVLAILKAGGAYVPFDPNYPEERIQFMLEDSGVELLVTQSHLKSLIPVNYSGAIIDIEVTDGSGWESSNLDILVEPENLAYVVYTSGSTGKPKGVLGQHGPLLNIYYAWREYYGLAEFKPVVLQIASISFDGFLCDLCHSIFSGGTVVICPAETRIDPAGLYDLMQANEVNIIESTPGIVLPLVDYVTNRQLDLSFLELLIVGSDAWHIEDYRRLIELFSGQFRIINCYGITETTVDVSCYEASAEELPASGMIPIGRPLGNVKVYLLDTYKNPVPVGVTGDMYIGGAGVGRGYWRRPELNAEKFVSDPFVPGKKMYWSGDLGRYRQDGSIEFLGRADNQVKIRGYRIEIGEVETAILKHPLIRKAIVLDKVDQRKQRYLVGYIETDHQFTIGEMRQELSRSLPDHMIPSHFLFLDKFPMTPNGKVDRRALNEMEIQLVTGVEYVPPQNRVQKVMAEVWAEILKVERVGINDNFFELGGDSLKIIQLTAKVNEALKVQLNPGVIYTNPTVQLLSQKLLEQENPLDNLQCVIPIRSGAKEKNIFCTHPIGGGLIYYRELSQYLDEEYNIYGIQARGLLSNDEPHTDNEERVRFYLRELKAIQPEGPYIIMGYCAGGDIAYEIVRQLENMGEKVERLLILDSWPFTKNRVNASMEAFEKLQWIHNFKMLGIEVPNAQDLTSKELYEEAISNEEFQRRASHITPGGIDSLRKVLQATYVAWQGYYPEQLIKQDMYLFKAVDNPSPDICKDKWQEWTTGEVTEITIPGDHATMLESPNVEILGAQINEVLKA